MPRLDAPLIERELQREGRRQTTYTLRAVAPGLVLLGLVPPFLYDLVVGVAPNRSAIASNIDAFATVVQAGVAYLVVPWIAARAIADESTDRTLDLLRLAEKSHLQFLGSKILPVWIHALTLLLGLIPLRVVATLLDPNVNVALVAGLPYYAPASAMVCAIALCFSALLKHSGAAFVAVMATLFTWNKVVQTLAYDNAAIKLSTLAILGCAAFALTPVILRRADCDVLRWGRARRHAAKPMPARGVDCVARLVKVEGGGIVTSLRAWPVQLGMAIVLALIAAGVQMPSASLAIAALVGGEAYLAGRHLRRSGVLRDLALTDTPARLLASGVLRGQMRNAWVFVPALVITIDLPARFQELVSLAQAADMLSSPSTSGGAAGAALAVVAPAYALLLIAFFTAAGIQYGFEGITAGRMIWRFLWLCIITSWLFSAINIGYWLIFAELTGPLAAPPPPTYGEQAGVLIAALVVLPILILDSRNRLQRYFIHVPQES